MVFVLVAVGIPEIVAMLPVVVEVSAFGSPVIVHENVSVALVEVAVIVAR